MIFRRLAWYALWCLILSPILLTACGDGSGENFKELTVERVLERMTLTEKIGQLFVVGIPGTELDPVTIRRLNEMRVGGFVLYSKNTPDPTAVVRLTTTVQRRAFAVGMGIPVLFYIDQEQGRVQRLENGVTLFPGNYALGRIDDPYKTRRAARITGQELGVLGIQVNLAPVSDVNSNPDNPVIGSRSFGEDPSRVAEMVSASIAGFQEAGMLPCAKHFPGHGDTDTDSHLELPVIDKSLEELRAVELAPFRAATAAGVDFVMTAHILFPEIDPDYPATASEAVLQGLLREELGFQGVIISDAIEMKALSDHFHLPDLAVRMIRSGCDLILFSENLPCPFTFEEIVEAVADAARSGDLPAERIDEAVRRILQLKKRSRWFGLPEEQLSPNLRRPRDVAFSDEIMWEALESNADAIQFPVEPRAGLAVLSDVTRFYAILPNMEARRLYITVDTPPEEVTQTVADAHEIWIFLSGNTSRSIVEQALIPAGAVIRYFSLNDPYVKGKLAFVPESYINLFAYKIPLNPVERFLVGDRPVKRTISSEPPSAGLPNPETSDV
jgi:beta-glucosidase-like glycosyl hydrolase